MSASLVGSEMCIRDSSPSLSPTHSAPPPTQLRALADFSTTPQGTLGNACRVQGKPDIQNERGR
eukprot:10933020-Alexandrium_andersonii.AAC.1